MPKKQRHWPSITESLERSPKTLLPHGAVSSATISPYRLYTPPPQLAVRDTRHYLFAK